MWTDNIILKFILYLVVSVSMMPETLVAQPYYYFFKPTTDRGEADIHWVNLRTGVSDLFLPNAGRILQVFWNSDQTKIFVQNRSVLDIIDANNPSERKRLLDPVDWVQDVLDAPQTNRVYISLAPEDIDYENSKTIIFSRTTYELVDTLPQFLSYNKPFFSADQRKVYKLIPNSTGLYFRAIDAFTGITLQQKRCGQLGPFAFESGLDDGKRGRALVSFETLPGFNHQHYVVCDPELGLTYRPIPFPWRSEGLLSPNAQYVILEQVNFDRRRESVEYRPGNVYVFEAQTGKLMQRLTLPPEGKVLIFDNYPDKFYYFDAQSLQSVPVDLTVITPTNVLLDTLIAMKYQAEASGWIGDKNFVKELDNHLENAQKHLAKGDSVNCGKEVEKFQEKVQKEYEKTVDNEKKNKPRDKRFVTVEGWKFLYYNAQYILDRLPKKGK